MDVGVPCPFIRDPLGRQRHHSALVSPKATSSSTTHPLHPWEAPQSQATQLLLTAASMKNLFSVILVVYLLRLPLALCMDMEEEKYLDRESAREITQLLTQFLRKAVHPIPAQKRNSELINSLLGLPKVMNDAGRK